MSAGFRLRVPRCGRDEAAEHAAEVLELRVHGVNNTTPAELLDLPPDAVELVAGDKNGSFWAPRDPHSDKPALRRGRVPEGIVREAYSWGGMVRTTPNFGGVGAAGVVTGVVARIAYALILPFSIGNAALWSAPVDTASSHIRSAVTAGLSRLFGLVLTLLFAMTGVTLSLDLVGAQCAAQPGLCAVIQPVLDPLAPWTAGQRLALFSLAPVAAVSGLWLLSLFSRHRYDVLPGLEGSGDVRLAARARPPVRAAAPRAVLSQPDFWSNRITGDLARAHVAGAVLLVAALVTQHVAVGSGHSGFTAVAILAAVLLAMVATLVTVLPTMSPQPALGGPAWPSAACNAALTASVVVFAVVLAMLVWALPGDALSAVPGEHALYGAGFVPLALVGTGAALAVSGIAWRPWRDRRHTAWAGCAPAVFLTLSLTLATSVSAITVVMIGDLLNGPLPPSELVRDYARTTVALQLPSVWVGLGTAILVALLLAVVVIAVTLVVPRSVTARAAAWGAPSRPGDEVVPIGPGVMPLSQRAMFARVVAARRMAATLHCIEPIMGVTVTLLGIGVVAGWIWTGTAYLYDVALWSVLSAVGTSPLLTVLNGSLWWLGVIGVVLVAVLASGATPTTPRPLGIVWDITCYLPRTGQPFGPPCYAQRAVPEIAGRVFSWLRGSRARRAVITAHSMGGVLAVSALGVLASSPDTRSVLGRVRLLTFGVQLRPYFGRMFPELLGPEIVGTQPALAPRLLARDPWARDFQAQRRQPPPRVDRLVGRLLGGDTVQWASLWRLTDYLGFPAVSTAPPPGAPGDASARPAHRGPRAATGVDRYAQEVDTSGYMVRIGRHTDYFRTPAYAAALRELAGLR